MSLQHKYRVVIGLEVHVQLLTRSKIFCGDTTRFGAEPNTQVSVISLAHPGTLPKLNRQALEYAIKMGLACESSISRLNIFDRKNYFYPDLPKGYQITQDRTPICIGGRVEISLKDGSTKFIQLNRIHLEEDAGKSIHVEGERDTLLDFNRAGMPLIEIVTEPVISTSEEASLFLSEIRKLVRYLQISDGNMEEGSLRCDANVSIMPIEASTFGNKVEIKNMNSFRYVQRAIDEEIRRQVSLAEAGQPIISETRTFDPVTGASFSMRIKEELNDYRYFPDPDLSPVAVTEEWLSSIRESMPALPRQLFSKFTGTYQLPAYDAQVLTESREIAQYYEEVCTHTVHYKAASNWIMGPVKAYLNELISADDVFPVKPVTLAELINLVDEGKVSFSAASQQVLPALVQQPGKSAQAVAQELNVMQQSNQEELLPLIEEVLNAHPEKVREFKKGKKGLKSMFIGEVMKRTKGKADPKLTDELITRKLQDS